MLIALEGIDGSGKGTQAKRLVETLKGRSISTALLSFPRYAATSFGEAIGDYLNGRFGTLEAVHPLLASLLFAGDRFESKAVLLDAIAGHQVVVLDRYVASNIAHQGSRCPADERNRVVDFIHRLEFEVYDLPKPDLTVLLDLPVATARQLIAKKDVRTYTDRKADLHEAEPDYLEGVRQVYLQLARNASDWHVVQVQDGEVRAIEDIAAEILASVLQHFV